MLTGLVEILPYIFFYSFFFSCTLTFLHSEQPKLNGVLAVLSAIG